MTRRPAFSELAWPDDPADADLPLQWAHGVATQVLDWTWRAFDALRIKHLARVDLAQPLEQLERDLMRHHFVEIQVLFASETDGYAALVPHHEFPEMESLSSPSAKPPAYDLAFVSTANQRWAWPFEAKVVPTPDRIAEYLKDVNEKFVRGIAAPLVGEGGMIAYLLTNETTAIFENLASRLDQVLEVIPEFRDRPHRASRHARKAAPALRLHHLVMECVGCHEDVPS
jgi:hypothetical protein